MTQKTRKNFEVKKPAVPRQDWVQQQKSNQQGKDKMDAEGGNQGKVATPPLPSPRRQAPRRVR